MNGLSFGRLIIYVVGIAAGGLAMAGYATFDPQTWILDIGPFDVKAFVLTLGSTIGNGLAAIAVWRQWGKK